MSLQEDDKILHTAQNSELFSLVLNLGHMYTNKSLNNLIFMNPDLTLLSNAPHFERCNSYKKNLI